LESESLLEFTLNIIAWPSSPFFLLLGRKKRKRKLLFNVIEFKKKKKKKKKMKKKKGKFETELKSIHFFLKPYIYPLFKKHLL